METEDTRSKTVLLLMHYVTTVIRLVIFLPNVSKNGENDNHQTTGGEVERKDATTVADQDTGPEIVKTEGI